MNPGHFIYLTSSWHCLSLESMFYRSTFPPRAADDGTQFQGSCGPQPTLAVGATPQFPSAQTMTAFPPATHDFLDLRDLLSPEERQVRDKVRAFAEKEVSFVTEK
jgi:hypothetical protein